MNALQKAVAKLTAKDKKLVTETIEKITKRSFRVRKGDFRILYYLKDNNEPMIIAIERRSEDTYKKF